MSEIQAAIDQLKEIHDGDAWHGPSLKEILTGMTAQQAAARPLPDAHSIWELVVHIAAWEEVFLTRLAGKSMDQPEAGDFLPVADTSEDAWRKTLTGLDETHDRLIETITGLTGQVATGATGATGAKVPGKDYNVAYLLRGIVRHHVYHAGQIMLLKKGL